MTTLEERQAWIKENRSLTCGPAHRLIKHASNLQEYYDNIPLASFFVIRLARTHPEEVYEALIHVLRKIPDTDLPEDLASACTALIENASKDVLLVHYKALNGLKKPAYINEYYRAVYYLLKWKLRKGENTNLIAVQEKLEKQLSRFNVKNHHKVLLGWFKEAIPFEKWAEL